MEKWEEHILSDEEMERYCHRISTSPENAAFTKDDGTLISPNTYKFVNPKQLCEAQAKPSFEAGGKEGKEKGRQEVIDFLEANFNDIGALVVCLAEFKKRVSGKPFKDITHIKSLGIEGEK